MKQLKQRFGSIYSEDEERVLGPWQRIRQFFLAPIAATLSRLGISPDMLSYASVALGIGFFLLAPFKFTVAFWLLVASIICDALDGVEVGDLDSRARRQNDFPKQLRGALVTSVESGSAAEEAGLKVGDVILEINRQAVRDADSAIELCKQAKGDRLLLRVWRSSGGIGGTHYIVVKNRKGK